MKRKICVVTGTRAEYGVLYWLIKGIKEDNELVLQLCVTGMHLSPEFGNTYQQIEADGFHIDKKVEMLLSSDTETGISKSMGLGLLGFADAFNELMPDIVLLLGDRFEIMAAATAAMIARIPIAHCCGGESTVGAIDEAIRHAITKMSHLHFVSAAAYGQRVIQLGEHPDTVFNVGALGLESILKLDLLNKQELEASLGIKLGKRNLMITFHPVTLEDATSEEQFLALLQVLSELKDTQLIFTLPNADAAGRSLIKVVNEYVKEHSENAVSFASLGQLRYLSTLGYIDAVVGNSSSGIIEAPSFNIGTVNIGDRQKGRIRATSVIDCEPTYESIKAAFAELYSDDFQLELKTMRNPLGTGNASQLIIPVLKQVNLTNILKKEFYEITTVKAVAAQE